MKKNVFISSTFEDLIPHRKAIWELLENYEVNVKGMEAFGARKESPLETCLNEVNQSDIYIGIIGYRFGSIENNSGKSFTQLEYERAVKEDKEILIYLINEIETKVEIKNVDFGEKRNKLQNFKSILKDKHTIDTFTHPENLTLKLKQRLDELLDKNKIDTSETDDYKESKRIIERFLLLPRIYSDIDVKLEIEFTGKAFPLSKDLCSSFSFSYGKTIGVPIKICNPQIDSPNLETLIIEERHIDFFFENKENEKVEIMARLLFTEKRIENLQANFFDERNKHFKLNPNYDPNRPSTPLLHENGAFISEMFAFSGNYNPKFIETTEIKKGEGRAILVLNRVINKAQHPTKL